MARFRVDVTDEYLARLTKSPRKGLDELIDNALDSDSRNINVTYERAAKLDTILTLTVTDDGDGMTFERARAAFGRLGGSWKRAEPVSRGGRRRLGNKGSGRWAAFAIGQQVTWTSRTRPESTPERTPESSSRGSESLVEVRITGDTTRLGEFDITGPTDVTDVVGSSGTVVEVRGVSSEAQVLDPLVEADRLTAAYAPVLHRQPSLTITVAGQALDAEAMVVNTHRVALVPSVTISGQGGHPPGEPGTSGTPAWEGDAVLRVVDWDPKTKNPPRNLIFSRPGADAHLDHTDAVPVAPWSYSAYLDWDGFDRHRESLLSPPMWDDELANVVGAAQEALRSHISGRRDQARRGLIESWKAEDSYPFADQAPAGPLEAAERDLFDLVATTAAPGVQGGDKQARRLSLRLIREALRDDPTHLTRVLNEVLALDAQQLADLDSLLQRTRLPALIATGKVISHRLDILHGLQALLESPGLGQFTTEKQHLHEIVAAEPWVFGDEYMTAVSERSLTAALRAHRNLINDTRALLDDDTPTATSTATRTATSTATSTATGTGEPVLVGGRVGRLDLMLSRVSPLTETLRQHLVVELKRPSVTLGAEEISQVEQYAFALSEADRFDDLEVRWDFLLIGSSMSRYAKKKAADLERSSEKAFKIRVMTWDDLIHQRLHQLTFVQNALALSADSGSGLDELKRLHATRLPPQAL